MRVHVINGRFQPFHLGHLQYARQAATDCDLLVAGLTRSSPVEAAADLGVFEDAAPHRFDDHHNPLSFAERACIVQRSLDLDPEIACPSVVSAFPIEHPTILHHYVPLSWKIVTTTHEAWNYKKISVLRELGYSVATVCEGEEKAIHGSVIRASLRNADDLWRSMVTEAAAVLIEDLGIVDRLAKQGMP